MENQLTVKFFTIDTQVPDVKCDSIQLSVSDNAKGEFSGLYGIRKGHAKAAFSLKAGKVSAWSGSEQVFTANISTGFAMVENNEVRITVDRVEK